MAFCYGSPIWLIRWYRHVRVHATSRVVQLQVHTYPVKVTQPRAWRSLFPTLSASPLGESAPPTIAFLIAGLCLWNNLANKLPLECWVVISTKTMKKKSNKEEEEEEKRQRREVLWWRVVLLNSARTAENNESTPSGRLGVRPERPLPFVPIYLKSCILS